MAVKAAIIIGSFRYERYINHLFQSSSRCDINKLLNNSRRNIAFQKYRLLVSFYPIVVCILTGN
jgi:hypothetical protein